jgi:MFS family permease
LLEWIVGFVSVALLAYAFAPTAVAAAIGAGVLGAGAAAMFVTGSSIVQRDAPPGQRGRVMSIMQACMGFSYGIGIMSIGLLGDIANLHVAFATGAVLLPIGFLALTHRSRHWRHAFDAGDPRPVVLAA